MTAVTATKFGIGVPLLTEEADPAAKKGKAVWTAIGVVAISLWSTSFAASRIVARSLGQITATGVCFTLGGLIATIVYAARGQIPGMLRNPCGYYLRCGIAFVMYPTFLYIAFHFAHNDVEVVTLTAVNYLWPLMMSILTVLVMKKQANCGLLTLGLVGAIYSILLVNIRDSVPMTQLVASFGKMWQATLYSGAAAYCWASYSVYAAYYSETHKTNTCVPLFTVVGGVVLFSVRYIPGFEEEAPGPFDTEFYAAMAYMILIPVVGCRFAWDYACSRGNIVILTSFAYLTPILATFWNVTLLGVQFQENMAFGSMGLAAAALAARFAIKSD
eukprot:TRINITY_DN8324_c0_g1_i1.p1 TRINITY_DN8324_c0_g1~~TRINITY_DN8324_c0_g1_i1.p1  ORF type:complete len:330 (+),score=44.46 TRINITY_DN8324_c0_g1_i1:97-1086(+)